MELDTALKNFASAFAAGPDNFGTVQYRAPQPVAGPIPLGAVLTQYYAKLEIGDKAQLSGSLLLHLFALDRIDSAQHGWRWIGAKDGSVTENPRWNRDWVVIADHHGDAIIVDDSSAGGTVFGAIGSHHFRIADDLASFFQVMAEAMLVEVETYDYEVYDDDDNPLPDFLDEISAIARRVLGPDGETGFMKFFFG